MGKYFQFQWADESWLMVFAASDEETRLFLPPFREALSCDIY